MSKSAMVMAAGLGTRMLPLTEHRPKPLVEVGGRALIQYSLDKLREAGVARIAVNIHYLPEMMEAYLVSDAGDFDLHISDERELLMETGGGLIKAQPHLPEEPFYCVNSDNIWTDDEVPSLSKMAGMWDGEQMDALLLLVPHAKAHNHSGPGDFSLNDAGRLVRRGDAESAPYVFSGIQLISHRLLRNPPQGPFSTNILWDRALEDGRLFGLVHSGDWFDIGHPGAIAPTEERLLTHG
ncbi:MAG: nucleotidyltransferase family protein [Sphingorhabdus sp.]